MVGSHPIFALWNWEPAGEGFRALYDVDALGLEISITLSSEVSAGAYAMETKAWSGIVYSGKGGHLMCNGQDRHSM